MEGEMNRIFFTFQVAMLVFIPALVYTYSKNLLVHLADNPEKKPVTDDRKALKKKILFYFYFSDQVVFDWAVYLMFSLLCGLFILGDFKCFHKVGILLWVIYILIVLAIGAYSLCKMRTKWKQGRLWIVLISSYAILPAPFLMYWITKENGKLFQLFSMGFSLGFYFWWHIVGGWLYVPLTSLIGLKNLDQ